MTNDITKTHLYKVLDVLNSRKQSTIQDISEKTGIPAQQVRNTLSELSSVRKVTKKYVYSMVKD